jgi:hypothetical protein
MACRGTALLFYTVLWKQCTETKDCLPIDALPCVCTSVMQQNIVACSQKCKMRFLFLWFYVAVNAAFLNSEKSIIDIVIVSAIVEDCEHVCGYEVVSRWPDNC